MGKVKLGDAYYQMLVSDEVCHYNSGVRCGLHACPGGREKYCPACGWNPVVEQARRKKVRLLIDGKKTT